MVCESLSKGCQSHLLGSVVNCTKFADQPKQSTVFYFLKRNGIFFIEILNNKLTTY